MEKIVTLEKLYSLVQDPGRANDLSVVFNKPYILVDINDSKFNDTENINKTIDVTNKNFPRLKETTDYGQPNCPVIALKKSDTYLPPIVDIVARTDSELEALTSAIEKSPIAATMLVQLLRHNEHSSVRDGLIAESLSYSCLQNSKNFIDWLAKRKKRAPPIEDQSSLVLLQRDDNNLHITLNREYKRNAYSAGLRDALYEALLLAATDDTILNTTIKGAGASFSAGGDLDEFGSATDSAFAHTVRMTRNVGLLLDQLKSKTQFNLHGACIGAGIELPSFSSEVIANRNSFFQLPEVAMGLIPGAGGTVSITKRIGRIRTAFMAISNQKITVDTALKWGLIDRIVDD